MGMCPRTASTVGGRPAPVASPRPPTSAQGATGRSGCPRRRQPQRGGLLPAPAPLKIRPRPGRPRGCCGEGGIVEAAGSPAARGSHPAPLARGQPQALPAGDGLSPPRAVLRPWVFDRGPRAGRVSAVGAAPRHLTGTPCHPKAQPNRTAWKPLMYLSPGYFRSGTGETSVRKSLSGLRRDAADIPTLRGRGLTAA